jgi:hypothetical protein
MAPASRVTEVMLVMAFRIAAFGCKCKLFAN